MDTRVEEAHVVAHNGVGVERPEGVERIGPCLQKIGTKCVVAGLRHLDLVARGIGYLEKMGRLGRDLIVADMVALQIDGVVGYPKLDGQAGRVGEEDAVAVGHKSRLAILIEPNALQEFLGLLVLLLSRSLSTLVLAGSEREDGATKERNLISA